MSIKRIQRKLVKLLHSNKNMTGNDLFNTVSQLVNPLYIQGILTGDNVIDFILDSDKDTMLSVIKDEIDTINTQLLNTHKKFPNQFKLTILGHNTDDEPFN